MKKVLIDIFLFLFKEFSKLDYKEKIIIIIIVLLVLFILIKYYPILKKKITLVILKLILLMKKNSWENDDKKRGFQDPQNNPNKQNYYNYDKKEEEKSDADYYRNELKKQLWKNIDQSSPSETYASLAEIKDIDPIFRSTKFKEDVDFHQMRSIANNQKDLNLNLNIFGPLAKKYHLNQIPTEIYKARQTAKKLSNTKDFTEAILEKGADQIGKKNEQEIKETIYREKLKKIDEQSPSFQIKKNLESEYKSQFQKSWRDIK